MHFTFEPLRTSWRTILVITTLFVGLLQSNSISAADDGARPISRAKTVLAIYTEDWGLVALDEPILIFALWGDGTIVWSHDELNGGAPYFAGQVEATRVKTLFSKIAKAGYFESQNLKHARFGPDSQFTTIHMKADGRELKMQSWHELFEADAGLVALPGITALIGRARLDVLAQQDAKWLHYRMAWAEFRANALALIPAERRKVEGKLVMRAGDVSWNPNASTSSSVEEAASKQKPRLGSAAVLQLALKAAAQQGYDPNDYNMTGCHHQYVKRDETWTVFFEMKPPTPPGGHFTVSVNDKSRATELIPGE